MAALSIFTTAALQDLDEILQEDVSVFKVEEAIPIGYQKDWEDGTVKPGICLFTLFNKHKDLSQEEFLNRWHNGHTPLSLKIHPLWNYNRNVVLEKVAGAEETCGGIVEEQFKKKSELLNPLKFFGHPFIMPYRV